MDIEGDPALVPGISIGARGTPTYPLGFGRPSIRDVGSVFAVHVGTDIYSGGTGVEDDAVTH